MLYKYDKQLKNMSNSGILSTPNNNGGNIVVNQNGSIILQSTDLTNFSKSVELKLHPNGDANWFGTSLGSLGYPSISNWVKLDIGASGSTYKSTCTGYMRLSFKMTSNGYVALRNTSRNIVSGIYATTGYKVALYIPVVMGDTIIIDYPTIDTSNIDASAIYLIPHIHTTLINSNKL